MKKQTEMILTQQLRYASRLTIWTFLLTVAHRILAFPDLLSANQFQNPKKAFFIGVASDFWTAACFSLLVLGVCIFFVKKREKLHPIYGFTVVFLSIAFAGHLNYVSFFKHPVIPLHLTYIYDWQFMQGMGASVFTDRNVLGIFFGGLIIGHVFFQPLQKYPRQHWKTSLTIFLSLISFATVAHALHNRYKEQWFIPETLRYNHLEGLIYQSLRQKFPNSFTSDEHQRLLNLVPSADSAALPNGYRAGQWPMHDFARLLRESVQKQALEGQKPILLVLAMESLRMADIDQPREGTRTPNINRLMQENLHFSHAHSTGNITRGAQEALLCGVFSGVNYSLMRQEVKNSIHCLAKEANIKNIDSFWYHGGHPLFDNQAAFWKKNQMNEQLSLEDFDLPEHTNGWGVHDGTFFKRATETLLKFREQSQAKISMGLMLSVSNHIPWDLPKDASPELQKILDENEEIHPSHKTVMYSDEALGILVTKLKELNLWQHTLLIITGDHGTLLPKLNQSYSDERSLLLSHVPLILAGGLAEESHALLNSDQASSLDHYMKSTPVSHAQVTPLLAYLLGLDALPFPTPPLFSTVDWPIFVNLGEDFYFPRSKLSWSREKLFTSDLAKENAIDQTALADLLFAKAYFFGLKKTQ